MAEKVIPESVMPQNIPACLMDENAQIPELDAFTFLNRVRALGIGSADFLYLLKGCDAPAEAIEKIESNPAMNLQSLVVTLEHSGLTPKDYTRMLYTARQLWERTLTMQLEEAIAEEEFDEQYDIPDDEETPVSDANFDENDTDEEQDDLTSDDTEEYQEPDSDTSEDTSEIDITGTDDAAADDELSIPESDDRLYDFYSDKKTEEYYDEDDDKDDAPALDFGNHDREEEAKSNTGKIVAAGIGAALLIGCSAAIEYLDPFEKPLPPPTASFAADSNEIFTKIYTAYNAGSIDSDIIISSGEYVSNERFGDLLVEKPDGLGVFTIGNNAFSAEKDIINIYERKDGELLIKFSIEPPEGAEFLRAIPQEDKLCILFCDEDSAGIIATNGNGDTLYTIDQPGILTDFSTTDSTISLGTVYIPPYDESFTAQQLDKFMPYTLLDGKPVVFAAEDIITREDTDGCGYAMYSEYQLSDGTISDEKAMLGAPVFSGAEDFAAVMSTGNSFILATLGNENEPVISTELAGLTAFDNGKVYACAQTADDGSTTMYLLDKALEPVSAVTNIPDETINIRIDDDTIYIYYIEGLETMTMVVDISDPAAPSIPKLTRVTGIVKDNKTLYATASSNLVKLTLAEEKAGTVKELSSYSKPLNLNNNELPTLSGANSFFITENGQCGVAYNYFDGVSKISEFGLFGKTKTASTLFDDKTGFTAAAVFDDEIYLIYGSRTLSIK